MFYRFIDADTIHIYIFCAWLGGEFVDSSSIVVAIYGPLAIRFL